MMARWIKRMRNGVVKFYKDHKVEIVGALIGASVVATGAAVCKHVDRTTYIEGSYILTELEKERISEE